MEEAVSRGDPNRSAMVNGHDARLLFKLYSVLLGTVGLEPTTSPSHKPGSIPAPIYSIKLYKRSALTNCATCPKTCRKNDTRSTYTPMFFGWIPTRAYAHHAF